MALSNHGDFYISAKINQALNGSATVFGSGPY
jgi:hypothetical protein